MLMSKLNSATMYKQTINHKNNFGKHSIKEELMPLKTRPVKELITTADQGAGVVNDVDELLTPMHSQSSSVSPKLRTETRPERNLWSKSEMLEMLRIMSENNAMEKINDKMIRSDYVFRDIEEIMHANGYRKKSFTQIWTKWKFLKSTYNTTKRSGTLPKVIPVEVYEKLCQLLEGCGDSSTGGDGSVGVSNSDCDNSMQSLGDDEKSNNNNGLDGTNCRKNGQVKPENDLSMAHPIFGYRLGIVKSEPVDTGYETVVNNDSNHEPDPDHFGYNQFHETNDESENCTVKQELVENKVNTPPPTAAASETPPPLQHLPTPPSFERTRSYGMGKRPASLTPTPLCSSTPQQQQPQQQLSQKLQQRLTSLRVAQFAKDTTPIKCATSGVLKIERPPLQLPMKSTPIPAAAIRVNNNVNGNSNSTFMQPQTKLMLPKLQQQQQSSAHGTYMRYPKDTNMQSASMLRLKQVPMRKTPYSLRPERMIPDLEQSISPPPSPMPTITGVNSVQKRYGYDSGAATTSHQAQIRMLNERKRRLGYDTPQPVPIKLQRNSQMPRLVQKQQQEQQHSHNNNSFATKQNFEQQETTYECDSDDDEVDQKSFKLKQEETFENELTKLSDAMRETQHNMMLDFFRQQKEFARQEHVFQTKQDISIMRAFRKQTEHLTKLVKDLLGVDYKSAANQITEEVKLKDMMNGEVVNKETNYNLPKLQTQQMTEMESSYNSANTYEATDYDEITAAENESYENDNEDYEDDAHNNNNNNDDDQQNEDLSDASDDETEESFDEMQIEAVPEIILET